MVCCGVKSVCKTGAELKQCRDYDAGWSEIEPERVPDDLAGCTSQLYNLRTVSGVAIYNYYSLDASFVGVVCSSILARVPGYSACCT